MLKEREANKDLKDQKDHVGPQENLENLGCQVHKGRKGLLDLLVQLVCLVKQVQLVLQDQRDPKVYLEQL